MPEKVGFTTGTLTGDLDAKFGATRPKFAASLLVGAFGVVHIATVVLSVLMAIPVVLVALVFFSQHREYLTEQFAIFMALFT